MRLAVMSDLHTEFDTLLQARCRACGDIMASDMPGRGLRCGCGASVLKRGFSEPDGVLKGPADWLDKPSPGFGDHLRALGGVDAILVAGDTAPGGVEAVRFLAREFVGFPVIAIAGNHEFYHGNRPEVLAALRAAGAETDNVRFLERDEATLEIGGRTLRVFGTTLWTDYRLFVADEDDGKAESVEVAWAMAEAEGGLNDHRQIREGHRKFRASDARREHELSLAWLRDMLLTVGPGEVPVVMTHHAPSARSVPPQFAEDRLSAAYASRLDDFVGASGAALWLHGHTHTATEYVVGDTKVICAARGYVGEQGVDAWKPTIVEI